MILYDGVNTSGKPKKSFRDDIKRAGAKCMFCDNYITLNEVKKHICKKSNLIEEALEEAYQDELDKKSNHGPCGTEKDTVGQGVGTFPQSPGHSQRKAEECGSYNKSGIDESPSADKTQLLKSTKNLLISNHDALLQEARENLGIQVKNSELRTENMINMLLKEYADLRVKKVLDKYCNRLKEKATSYKNFDLMAINLLKDIEELKKELGGKE